MNAFWVFLKHMNTLNKFRFCYFLKDDKETNVNVKYY